MDVFGNFLLAMCLLWTHIQPTKNSQLLSTGESKVGYIKDVRRQTGLLFAVKSQHNPQIWLFKEMTNVGSFRIGVPDLFVQIETGCSYYNYDYNDVNMTDFDEFKWHWISWESDNLAIGTGQVVGLNVVGKSPEYVPTVSYLGFGNLDGGVVKWMFDQTDERIKTTRFNVKENTRTTPVNTTLTVWSKSQCSVECSQKNGCYGFNYMPTASIDNCELITQTSDGSQCVEQWNLTMEHNVDISYDYFHI